MPEAVQGNGKMNDMNDISKVTSTDIKKALADKHYAEFFMTEVKTGSTWLSDFVQMDALAMYKSWTHQRIVGYEIKVSRGDFLRDAKMTAYLKYCHEFSVVCPYGLIAPTELPIEFGLVYFNPSTGKLVTKRKAQFRRIEVDADLLYYVIMYRLKSDRYPFHNSKAAYFREWLENRDNNRLLGRDIRGKLIEEIRRLNDELDRYAHFKADRVTLEKINAVLDKHGIHYWGGDISGELDKALTHAYPSELDAVSLQLAAAIKSIEAIKTKGEKDDE